MLLRKAQQSSKIIMYWNGFLAVGIGAASGAWLRWGLSLMLNPLFSKLPLGTLSANLLGGYLIGLMLGLCSFNESLPVALRLLIVTGFLGGLTTFSTFSAEVVTLFLRQQYTWAIATLSVHVFGSLMLTLLGVGTIQLLRSYSVLN